MANKIKSGDKVQVRYPGMPLTDEVFEVLWTDGILALIEGEYQTRVRVTSLVGAVEDIDDSDLDTGD